MKDIFIILMIILPYLGKAQQTLMETFGTVPGTTSIAAHEAANGFVINGAAYSGTADLRSTTVSTGYPGASGGANVFFTNSGTASLIITGLTPNASCSSITLTFGIQKNINADDGANFQIQYSTNGGGAWTSAGTITLPTGAGTTGWYQRSVSGIPGNANAFQFRNLNTTGSASNRLDDLQIIGDGSGCVLPVRLISFKSEAQSAGVELTWQTGEETDNSHFDIEKSSNAQHFEAIGRVSGKGNSSGKQVYSYFDASPKNGPNYYRLKQVDLDGKFEYSRIVSSAFTGAGIFKVYPNPVSSVLRIDLPDETKIESAFLYDLTGRRVKEFSTDALKLEGIDNGIYFLHVHTKDGRTFREQILKMN